MMKILLVFLAIFNISDGFELGRLYHYSYDSKIVGSSFGFAAFRPVKLAGHVDVCSIWSDGENELLRVEFHAHHRHSASGVQPDFAIAHVRGDRLVDTLLPASFSNSTVSSLLTGFVRHLVARYDESMNEKKFLVKNEFDNSFGQHHLISIDAKQLVTLPLFGSDRLEPVSISTTVQAHLLSTSECSQISIEAKDIITALEVASTRTGSALEKLPKSVPSTIKVDTKPPCTLYQAISQVDCIASSPLPELHKSLFTNGIFSKPLLVRRYYSDMCIGRHDETQVDLIAAIIKDSLDFSANSDSAGILQEINFGIACLLNHVCLRGQSKTCQKTSGLVFEHLQSSYKKCANSAACQLALVRAFDASLVNFPLAESFMFEIATEKDQHPQIAAGSFRALGRSLFGWVPSEAEFQQLIEFFEKSHSPEVRFATLDLFLSPKSFLLKNKKFAKEFGQVAERIASNGNEFGAYLSTRLRALISSDNFFRKFLLSNYGRIIFSLTPKSEIPITSVFVEGPLFPKIPVNYVLDVQNVAPDTLVHSSFSVRNGDWRLFEVEIDAVGIDALMGSAAGSSDGAKSATPQTDPAVSISLKLSGASDRGVALARHADLFRGQEDMMSAVWSAPSDLTDIAQVNSTIFDHTIDRIRLINGLTVESGLYLTANVHVQGSASVSLWTQSAETLIATNLGVSAKSSLSIPVLGLSRSFEIEASSDIAFRTNIALGSSGKPDVCLRMTREKAQISSVLKSKTKTTKSSLLKVAPVNYAFHVYNSQACKKQLQDSGDSW